MIHNQVNLGKRKISCLFHPARVSRNDLSNAGVVMVGGAGGEFHGPGGIYHDLGPVFEQRGITAVQLDFKKPNHLSECVSDVRDVLNELHEKYNVDHVVLIGMKSWKRIDWKGWSFGGAVVITVGAQMDIVKGVCTVASQTYGTEAVRILSPKSLLLLHGTGDTCLNSYCSESLYAKAKEPKELVLYQGDNHGLTHHSEEAKAKILEWTTNLLRAQKGSTIPNQT